MKKIPSYDEIDDFNDTSKCKKFYDQLFKCGYGCDKVTMTNVKNMEFIYGNMGKTSKEEFKKQYNLFNGTSVGNLGYIVAYADDVNMRKKSYEIIDDYFYCEKRKLMIVFGICCSFIGVSLYCITR